VGPSRIEPVPRAPLVVVPHTRERCAGPGLLVRLDEQLPGRPVIRMRGVVDRSAATLARRAMYDALAPAPHTVVVDLHDVIAMDGAGAVLMVAMARHARRFGSALRIEGARPGVRAAMRDRRVEPLLDLRP
jgi:anti-anti-sigma factor